MTKIYRHLPEGIGAFILIVGMSTIVSKATIALQANPDYKPDLIQALVYVGAAFAAFAILKAVQLICDKLFSEDN